jgi:RNA polymerase sigma-70 factor, ECF subfamily
VVINRLFAGLTRRAAGEVEQLTLEAVVCQHGEDVHRIVRRLLGPGSIEADVDDLMQQVFLAVHRALPQFRGDSKTTTWIYGIASRTVLHYLRGRRRYRRMVAKLEEQPSTEHRTEGQLESRDELRLVWRCLLQINPKKRVVFVLHEIEGFSGPEVAEMLAISEATMRSRLHRARRELMTLLAKEEAR